MGEFADMSVKYCDTRTRTDMKIHVVRGRKETKLLQYADDTTAVLSDINSARALFKLLDDFQKLSGLRVNPIKTEGMWIGSSRQNKTKPLGIKWPDEPIKALGIYNSHDPKLLHEKISLKS